MTTPFHFTIDRSVWLRGERLSSTLLRSCDGKRCCVGIYLAALGVPDEDLRDLDLFEDVHSPLIPAEAAWLAAMPNGEESLYQVNDYDQYAGDREKRVRAIFARHDVLVEFADRVLPDGSRIQRGYRCISESTPLGPWWYVADHADGPESPLTGLPCAWTDLCDLIDELPEEGEHA